VCCNGNLLQTGLTRTPRRVVTPRVASSRTPSAVGPERALLLERAAAALAHEGKNPLHNMVLHVQLVGEKVREGEQGGTSVERHLQALRDGIARVDALLRAFSDLASPGHLEPDLGAAVSRAQLLFGSEARRGSVAVMQRGPASVPVKSDGEPLCDLVCHAFLAAVALARDGALHIELESDGPRARLELRAEGGAPRREEAAPHLEAVRRLALEAGAELSADLAPAAPARLSLSFAQPR
jgi:C4-dicarboxylate-specific signal transduction histidine kinase